MEWPPCPAHGRARSFNQILRRRWTWWWVIPSPHILGGSRRPSPARSKSPRRSGRRCRCLRSENHQRNDGRTSPMRGHQRGRMHRRVRHRERHKRARRTGMLRLRAGAWPDLAATTTRLAESASLPASAGRLLRPKVPALHLPPCSQAAAEGSACHPSPVRATATPPAMS